MEISDFLCNFSPYSVWEAMTQSSFAWDLPRNLTIKCSLFCTKFILKNLYLAENSLYKKPLFLRETARGPEPTSLIYSHFVQTIPTLRRHIYLIYQLQYLLRNFRIVQYNSRIGGQSKNSYFEQDNSGRELYQFLLCAEHIYICVCGCGCGCN